MNDFESSLSTLLDDIAEHVRPQPDADAVLMRATTPVHPRRHTSVFRPRLLAGAAAAVMLVGGAAFAVSGGSDHHPDMLKPAETPTSDLDEQPSLSTASVTTTIVLDTSESPPPSVDDRTIADAVRVSNGSDGAPTDSKAVPPNEPSPTTPKTEPTTPPTEPTTPKTEPTTPKTEPTTPKTEPTAPPTPVEFTAQLGASRLEKTPMKQVFFGTAQAGSAIRVASDYGVVEVQAGSAGKWEAVLLMYEVPSGATVHVRVTASSSDKVFEFDLVRPVEAPVVYEFTANLGTGNLGGTPMTQGFYGKAQPGSAIRVGSEFGVVETVANEYGKWEALLTMNDVPPGTEVGVRVTANTSAKVWEFVLKRPGDTAPPSIDFTANAALTTSDKNPPVNEYWGTSTPGAVITISSPYGGTQVEASAEGKWSARVEFPGAPLDTPFNVHLVSTKGTATYDFTMTYVSPG